MTVDTLSADQAKDLVHKGRVVDWDGKIDVAGMAGTGLLAEIACRTAGGLTQCVSLY